MSEVIVGTTVGRVRGTSVGGILRFLGVPYGGSTAGTARFRPPLPAEHWPGIRDALELGPRCPQPDSPLAGALEQFGEPSGEPSGEDCLVLNVWTPGTEGAIRPVFVYLHGGGWVMGSGGAPAYDGTNLSRRGDIVVVTINHRLGILGHLHLGEIGGNEYRGSGNAGLLDVVAALEWVRDNIASFGGDPSSVTLGGQSGGGWKTSTLMGMPAADGLFHRALIMSGPMLTAADHNGATEAATAALAFVGVDPVDLGALGDVALDRLLEFQFTPVEANGGAPYEFGAVVDGVTLPATPLECFRRGTKPDVPLLIGGTRHEHARTLHMVTSDLTGFVADDDQVRGYVRQVLGEQGDHVVSEYRTHRPDLSSTQLYVAVITDLWVGMPAISIAEQRIATASAPVFMYRFDWETPVVEGLGAAHGLDVPFAFDNTWAASLTGSGSDVLALGEAMSESWISFIRTGDPSSAATGMWPAYTLGRRSTMIFDSTAHVEDDPSSEDRLVWEAVPTELLGRFQIPGF